jgi:ATP adenylyltransferase
VSYYFNKLQGYIVNEMRMSHIYQPAMLKEILINGGQANVNQIAKHLLSYDEDAFVYTALSTLTVQIEENTSKSMGY